MSERELHVLPPSCSLDSAGSARQGARYAAIGRAAGRVERFPGVLAIRLSQDLDENLVREAVEVERHCCPHLAVEYEPAARLLRVEGAGEAGAATLDAIEAAIMASWRGSTS